jgi:hypothetical protein
MAKTFVIPQDPEARKKIMTTIREISGSFTRVEAERDYVKEAIKALAEEHQLPKKYLSKFAKDYHKSATNEAREQMSEYEELLDALDPPQEEQE